MRALHLLFGALLLASCEEGSTRTWSGEHVTFVSGEETDLEPCGGQVAFSDRLAQRVGESWSPSGSFSLSSVVDLRLEGTQTQSGNAVQGSAWASRQSALIHEIGHLVVFERDGVSAPVFSEGIAELIGPSGLLQSYLPPPDPATFAYLQRPEFSTPQYYLSAQLLSFLARRYGLVRVRDAYQRAEPGATPEQIDAAFVEAFGDEIYDAFEDFQSEPQCPLLMWQCRDEVVPTMELPFSLDLDPRSCTGTDIPGFTTSKSDDWYPEYVGVLRLSEPRLIRYQVDNATIVRQECQESCTPMESLPPWTWQSISELLGQTEFTSHTRAGDHHLKIRPDDPQRAFSVEIVDLGPA